MGKSKIVGDFSKWNVITDYKKAAEALDGAILRIGYRSSKEGKLTEDPKFKTHLNGFISRIPVGVYFFTTAVTNIEAMDEAMWVINTLKKYRVANKLRFPIAIDTEWCNKDHSGRSDKLYKDIRTDIVSIFCEYLESCGYDAMIYASDDWFVSQLEYEKIKKFKKWVARYSSSKPSKATDNVVGWQKTDNYECPGVTKGIDISEWYDDIKKAESNIKVSNKVPIIVAGAKVSLVNEKLYSSSSNKTPATFITGDFYIWSPATSNGKIRITNKPEYAGVLSKVTGWIDIPK